MVPASDTVEDIRVEPLAGLEVEVDEVGELRVAVPATVGVQLIIDDEDRVATTAHGRGLGLRNGLILLPGMSLKVEAEDVIESPTLVIVATVSTVDVDLTVVKGGAHVGTRKGSADGGVLVSLDINVTLDALPDNVRVVRVRHFEDPAIVETHSRAGVTTEDENLILWLGLGAKTNSGVLGTRAGELVSTVLTLLFPEAVLYTG